MGKLFLNGAQVHFEDEGAGPAVLFLHAFPLNGEMWASQRAALRDAFRTVAVDFPGFGRSQPLGEPASMGLFSQAALSALDALAIHRAAVVGLSMGGYVSFELLAQAPGRIAALALCDTRAGPDTEQGRKAREDNARAVEREGSAALIDRLLPNLLSKGASAAVRAEVEHHIRAAPPKGAAAALRAMAARKDFAGLLPRIACPALVLVGASDNLTPPSESKLMAQAIPSATYREIRAGHLSNLEAPSEFNAVLRGFLDSALPRA